MQQLVDRPVSVCTSTMPFFALADCLKLAAHAGYQGIELRVHDSYHVSLRRLSSQCHRIKRDIEAHSLELSVYNAYYGITDASAVDALIQICRRTNVKHFRLTLPTSANADVRTQAFDGAVIPSYSHQAKPADVLRSVKTTLQNLAMKTRVAGVCALLEIHWGTVMSSFSAAHYLVGDLDPGAIAITFDPANMIIEGKEDWEHGIQLLRDHIANVHIKNVSWIRDGGTWKWRWDTLGHGMVNWPCLFALLSDAGYTGMYSVEDFRVPQPRAAALAHLRELRDETRFLVRQGHSCQVA